MKTFEHVVPFIVIAAVLVFVLRRRRAGGRPTVLTVARKVSVRVGRKSGDQPFLGVTGLIAAREIGQRVRGRAFRIASLLVLAAVIAAIVIPTLTSGSTSPGRLGIVGSVPAVERSQLVTAIRSAGIQVQVIRESDRSAAANALRSGRVDLVVVADDYVLVHKALSSDDTSKTAQVTRAVAKILGDDRAIERAGLSAVQIGKLAAARPAPIQSLAPASGTTIVRGVSVTGTVLVFILLTQYLSWTLIGVMQEKANRVVEVLLATVRPLQLLAGKLLGIGVVVFAQAAVIVGVALATAAVVGSNLLDGATPLAVTSQLLWLLLGYAFYSWLYAAAGSLVERQDQVQSLAIPLAVPLIFGYVVAVSAAGAGHSSTLLDVLAYLPPTAPFAMPILVALKAVSWWQFAASAALTVGGTVATAKLAATVYRRAILHTGQRVRLRQVFRSTQTT